MNVFVTGATGLLGAAFVRHLLATRTDIQRVYVLVRGDFASTDTRVRAVRASFHDPSAFATELRDSDYVFHIGANANFSGGADYEAENVAPTRAMLDILRGGRLRHFVFISSIGAADRAANDGCSEPLRADCKLAARSAYGRSKRAGEDLLRHSGLPHSIVRPTWIYGRDMRLGSHVSQFITMVARRSPVTRIGFPGRVSLVHVDDLARALVDLLDRTPGATFFAASESLALGEIFAILHARLHGRRPSQLSVSVLRPLVARVHAWLPIAVANLFVDYLCADETDFRKRVPSPRSFREAIAEVVAAHPQVNGAVVITGAGGGIGLAMARQLRHRRLILIDKEISALASFDGHAVHRCDLTDRAQITALGRLLEGERIHALINNAGVGYRRSTEQISVGEALATVELNALAPVLLTKHLLPRLKKDRSRIVNVGSSVAYNPLPGMSLYAASKAFLVSWSEALSYELRATNRVLTVSPSGTRTGFQNTAGVKETAGLADADAVAKRIISAMERGREVLILGAPSRVLLLVSRLLPRAWCVRLWGALFGGLR